MSKRIGCTLCGCERDLDWVAGLRGWWLLCRERDGCERRITATRRTNWRADRLLESVYADA